MESRLYKIYKDKVVPAMKEEFGFKNVMQVPKIKKVTVNVGYGRNRSEASFVNNVKETLQAITGQKPVVNKAKKSISNFKIREGMDVGVSVILRGQRMYEFVDKLVSITLPRVRDFRGISPKAFDRQGNYTIGLSEHIAFPEIKSDAVEKLHGLQIVITTNAKNKEEGLSLLEKLGFPFKKK